MLADHVEIKRLFAEVGSATGDAKRDAFEALMRKLAIHETAEQEVVHPLLRGTGAEEVTEQRLAEEKQGERALAELQKMGVDNPGFPAALEQLRDDVLRHASSEETQEHPQIRAAVDAERLRGLATVFRAAEAVAPTRPHPRGPVSATANIVAGPLVSIMDRTRDALQEAMRKLGV